MIKLLAFHEENKFVYLFLKKQNSLDTTGNQTIFTKYIYVY